MQKLEAILEEKLPGCGLKGDAHIGSRVKTLKTKWSVLHNMLCLSGFGWDSGAMKLICDKSVFEDYVKKRPAASELLNKPFPHYYTLGEIYGCDRATIANAGNADDDEEEVRQEDNLNVNLGNDSTNKVSMNDFGDDISSANKSAPSQAENVHSSSTNKSKKRKKKQR